MCFRTSNRKKKVFAIFGDGLNSLEGRKVWFSLKNFWLNVEHRWKIHLQVRISGLSLLKRWSCVNPQTATVGETVCVIIRSTITRDHCIWEVGGRRDLIRGHGARNILTTRGMVSHGTEYCQMRRCVASQTVTDDSENYCPQASRRHIPEDSLHCNGNLQNRPATVRNRRQ
jgi:hypothetical protein